MNIAATSNAETLNFARFLGDITECRALVLDLRGEAEPADARDMATRHRKLIEAVAQYIERDLRNMQRFADVELSRYPRADLKPTAVAAAVMEVWTDFVRPHLRDLEDYLLDVSEHDRDPMAEHRHGKHEMGLR
jgi:hypothetical protein